MGINRKTLPKQGFSLIQVSMLIAVAGIILASILPGGEQGSTNEKDLITKDKMEKIEEATRNFMASNLRRPCPADGTLAIGSANFGVEDTTQGRCSGSNFYTQATPLTKTGATTTSGSPVVISLSDTTGLSIGMLVTAPSNIDADSHIASIDSATQITLNKIATGTGASGDLTFTTVAAGVVPTKTLGLPDEYMFDGYGRRIGYMVDIRATDRTTCRDMTVTKTPGAIQIMDSAAATAATDNVMWSLVSYGQNGHGAFPMGGSSVANRINSGATNDDEEVNAFVNTAGTFATAFTQKLVKYEPITSAGATYFDDFVWTQEATKNTCCTGKMCNLGTRIGGTVAEPLPDAVAIGDINGDGISDIVSYEPFTDKIRVFFGSRTGWTPSGSLSTGTANSSRFITITNDSAVPRFLDSTDYYAGLAVGDLNGDGYDDIAMSYGNGTNAYVKVFYGSANPVSTNLSAITNTITFPPWYAPQISIGHFANTTHKDLFALVQTVPAKTAYIIYGAGSYSLTAEAVTTVASSVGFKIVTTPPAEMEIIVGQGGSIGDVNGDGYDDIVISNYNQNNMYILFGQSQANWDADKTTAATGSTPDIVNLDTRVAAGGTEAVKFINGGTDIGQHTIAIADINGDGTYKDILFNNNNYFYVYYGKSAGSWASTVDLSAASSYNGTDGFRIDVVTTKPGWVSSTFRNAYSGDINGDGKQDLVFNNWAGSPNSASTSGANFILFQPSAGWSSIWTGGTITLFSQAFDAAGTGLPLNNDASKAFRIDGQYASSETGILQIADIDGDGKNDLIGTAVDDATFSDVGDIYIFFGKNLVPWDSLVNVKQLNRF